MLLQGPEAAHGPSCDCHPLTCAESSFRYWESGGISFRIRTRIHICQRCIRLCVSTKQASLACFCLTGNTCFGRDGGTGYSPGSCRTTWAIRKRDHRSDLIPYLLLFPSSSPRETDSWDPVPPWACNLSGTHLDEGRWGWNPADPKSPPFRNVQGCFFTVAGMPLLLRRKDSC